MCTAAGELLPGGGDSGSEDNASVLTISLNQSKDCK